VIAYGDATRVEYASISSQWRMGNRDDLNTKKVHSNQSWFYNQHLKKKNLRLKNFEGNAKFPQFLFSKKIKKYRISL
jgi:hypothetical protein